MTEMTKVTKDALLAENSVVVADFWAAWCGPCMMFAPVFGEAAENNGDKAKFVKVNVDEEPEIAVEFGIVSIPTVLAFKNGKVVKKAIGLIGKEEFENWLSDIL